MMATEAAVDKAADATASQSQPVRFIFPAVAKVNFQPVWFWRNWHIAALFVTCLSL
jgi:hypothetical protein